MKSLILATFLLIATNSALAQNSGQYFCYGEDGSDVSMVINLKERFARIQGEDFEKTFKYSGAFESLPPIHVFGDYRNDCAIKFKPSNDGLKGNAKYSCNKAKYPNSTEWEMPCSLEAN